MHIIDNDFFSCQMNNKERSRSQLFFSFLFYKNTCLLHLSVECITKKFQKYVIRSFFSLNIFLSFSPKSWTGHHPTIPFRPCWTKAVHRLAIQSIVWLNMISVSHECLFIIPTGYHTQIMRPNLHTKLLCGDDIVYFSPCCPRGSQRP